MNGKGTDTFKEGCSRNEGLQAYTCHYRLYGRERKGLYAGYDTLQL